MLGGIMDEILVDQNTGYSCIVSAGNHVRIIAESTVDFVIFNAENLCERFDQARTKSNQGKIYITTGDALYSKINNVMMTIVEDNYKGAHDLQYGMCSKFARDEQWKRRNQPEIKSWFEEMNIRQRSDLPDHGCYENIMNALQNYPILPVDIPSPLNLFQSVEISRSGKMIDRRNRDRHDANDPAQILFRAEMNCLVALSACPETNNKGKAVRVQLSF